MRGRLAIVVLFLLSVGAAVAWFRLAPAAGAFGLFEGSGQQILRVTAGYLATVAGVLLGSFYRQLRQMRDSGVTEISNVREFVSRGLRSVDLWMGLCGSPIVFLLLARSNEGMSLPGIVVVALENGFCCLIIVNGFVGRMEAENKAPTPS